MLLEDVQAQWQRQYNRLMEEIYADGKAAGISWCERYRYWLSRSGEPGTTKQRLFFVMLNPSTADARIDDPTIRRCLSFSKRLGTSGLVVANLYALRATNPDDLWRADDPVGRENDDFLRLLAFRHKDVVCAWGANAKAERVRWFCEMMKEAGARLWCLGTTKSGAPRHPLYVKGDQELIRWNGEKSQ